MDQVYLFALMGSIVVAMLAAARIITKPRPPVASWRTPGRRPAGTGRTPGRR